MALVAAGIIVAWPSTVGTIPAGWSRVTALDSLYLRGAAAGGTTGGGAHTHAAPGNHTHVQAGHNHAVAWAKAYVCVEHHGVGLPNAEVAGCESAAGGHTHAPGVSAGTIITNQAASFSVNDATPYPPYLSVIWIESDGTTRIPDGAVGWWDDATLPPGWAKHAAADTLYLRGAAPGGDGGGPGGSATHTHTSPAHTHTQLIHSHGNQDTAPYTAPFGLEWIEYPNNALGKIHRHTYSLSGTVGTNSADAVIINNGTVDPEYIKLFAIENTSGASDLPVGIIAAWLGTKATVPFGWFPCDGTHQTPDTEGKFVKTTEVNGELEDTGGNASHGHTTVDHTHTAVDHPHTIAAMSSGSSPRICDPDPHPPSRLGPHTHGGAVTPDTGANADAATSISDATASPPYCTVVYIQYAFELASTLVRPRPADLWRVGMDGAGGIAVDDIHADGAIDEHHPYLGRLSESPSIWDLSATWFTGTILAAVIEGPLPGQVRTGFLTKDEWIPAGDIPVIGDGFEFVELDMMPAGAMAVALMLYNDAGTYRWYQACGLWDHAAGEFDWTAVPIECETAGVDFPDAGYSKGSLRRGDDAGLLFAFQNSDDESVLYRCASMPSNATGEWVEV